MHAGANSRYSHCFCILGSTNKIHLANQINHAGNTLLTDSHEIIPCSGQTGQKPSVKHTLSSGPNAL